MVQYPDLNPGGASATSNTKNVFSKSVRFTFADFTTGGTATQKVVLPADATILSVSIWKKTQFSGGSVSAATLSLGVTGSLTSFLSAVDVFSTAVGSQTFPTVAGIYQNYGLPLGTDTNFVSTGTATTGNPTAGEIYLNITYVR